VGSLTIGFTGLMEDLLYTFDDIFTIDGIYDTFSIDDTYDTFTFDGIYDIFT